MEAEERPAKIRKLSHEEYGQQQSHDEAFPDVLPGNVDGDHKKQRENIESANGTTTPNSLPERLADRETKAVEAESTYAAPQDTSAAPDTPALSKNQQKKLRKKQEWEAGREERKIFRKQKLQEKKARKRAARDVATEEAVTINGDAVEDGERTTKRSSSRPGVPGHVRGMLLPITFVIDCAFDNLMHERERISLASQITRCYSDNHRAPFKAHLAISSWGGELRKRFDNILSQHYKKWRGVRVLEEDFVEAADRATEWMAGRGGGKLAGAFALNAEDASSSKDLATQGEVVYLTSDSENTLDRLKPYSTYIIGGLVDKNRHKGICYKSACDRGVKTAKLPIGEYMDMQSRYVLATNHVVEIMVRWLECGDWGEAFLKVMPKRKGGRLKDKASSEDGGEHELGGIGDGTDEAQREIEDMEEDVEDPNEQRDTDKVDNAEDGHARLHPLDVEPGTLDVAEQ